MIIFKGKSSNVYTPYFIKESFNWNWLKDHRQWRQSLQLDKWCMCAVPGIGRGTRGKGLNWKQLWWWWHFLMFCLLVGGLVTMRAQSWKPWGTLLLQAPSDFSWFLKITKTPIWSFLFKEPGHWWQQWRLRTALPPTCLLSANYYLSIPVHLTPPTPALTLIWAWGSCLMLVEGTRQHSNNDRPCPSILLSSAAKLLAMMEELEVQELRGWVTTHWGVWVLWGIWFDSVYPLLNVLLVGAWIFVKEVALGVLTIFCMIYESKIYKTSMPWWIWNISYLFKWHALFFWLPDQFTWYIFPVLINPLISTQIYPNPRA